MSGAISLTKPKYNILYSLFLTHSSIRQLKKEVSPSLYDSLTGMWNLLKSEILIPLALSQNSEEFKRREKKAFPQFFDFELAIFLLLLSYYKDDFEKFANEMRLAIFSLKECTEKRAKKYFTPPEELTLKNILSTIKGIKMRSIQWAIKKKDREIKWSGDLENFVHCAVLLGLHLTFIFSIMEGEIKTDKKNLLKISLEKARVYANRYFYYAKRLRILAPSEKRRANYPKTISQEARRVAEESTKEYIKYLTGKLERENE